MTKKAGFSIAAIFLLLTTCLLAVGGRVLLISGPAGRGRSDIRLVPEHELTLGEVVISISVSEHDLALHDSLLEALPAYSEIYLVLPSSREPEIRGWLDGKSYADRVEFFSFETVVHESSEIYFLRADAAKLPWISVREPRQYPHGTTWAQDLFEVAHFRDGLELIVSDTYKYFYAVGSGREILSDNTFVTSLSPIVPSIRRSKLSFSGGNIVVDRRDGENIVFCGVDLYTKTLVSWESTGSEPGGKESVTEILRDTFNAERIVVVGEGARQPALLFHLDQAMIVLSEGVVGVTRIIEGEAEIVSKIPGIDEVEAFLDGLRSQLLSMNYEVVDILTTPTQILNRQYTANAVAYTDRTTGAKVVLMPSFVDSLDDRHISEQNRFAFRSQGYHVVPVESRAFEQYGGIHCLINIME